MVVGYGVFINEATSIVTDPDLVIPKQAEIQVDDSTIDCDIVIEATYDYALRRYVASKVSASRRGDGLEVNGSMLRELRVQEYIRDGLRGEFDIQLGDGSQEVAILDEDRRDELVAAGPGNRETLLWLARIYRSAEVLNVPPVKAVQEQLGLTQSTATLWVRRARAEGILS